MRWVRLIFAIAIVVFLLPVASPFIAIGIASIGGCRVDEAGIYPCAIAGLDFGTLVGTLFVYGWLALVTLPMAMAAALAWIVCEVVAVIWRRRQTGS